MEKQMPPIGWPKTRRKRIKENGRLGLFSDGRLLPSAVNRVYVYDEPKATISSKGVR